MTSVRSLDELEATPHARPFPDAEPDTVRLELEAGESVPPHTHPDRRIVLYLIEGAIELEVGEETHELAAGDVARFEGDREISPRAIEDSTALIVLARRATD